jgi:hypothetical protein
VRVPESEAGRHGWPYEAYEAAKPPRFLGHSHPRLPLPDVRADGRQAAAASHASRARVPRVGRRSRELPARRGRRSLTDTLVMPFRSQSPNTYTASLPGGGTAKCSHGGDGSYSFHLRGRFERAELQFARDFLSEGQHVIDVGANVGYLTVPMALRVDVSGRAIACEPEPENLNRLQTGLRGSVRLLRKERPWLMLDPGHVEHVPAYLPALNYASVQPGSFATANFIFAPRFDP